MKTAFLPETDDVETKLAADQTMRIQAARFLKAFTHMPAKNLQGDRFANNRKIVETRNKPSITIAVSFP